MAVTSEVLHRATFVPELACYGTVTPAATVAIAAPAGGIVTYPRRFGPRLATGEQVALGEVVAEIHSEASLASVEQARIDAEDTQIELARCRKGDELGIESKQNLARCEHEARMAQARLVEARRAAARLQVRSPAAGRLVVTRELPAGSEVVAGALLAEVAAAGPLRVVAFAAAADRALLRPGLAATLLGRAAEHPEAQQAAVGKGRVVEVAPVVDAAGTVRLVIELAPAAAPGAGEGVEVRIALPARPDAITVPEAAVAVAGDGDAVYVLEPAGEWLRARRRAVCLGGRGGGRIEVTAGLAQADRVAVAGVAGLGDGGLAVEAAAPPETPR
ncbi:MAG TPA: efflux RND transporter periplasmic adaptor subunit [Thermoanaerobaculia bacterium]|nr:efflux RND transporter periplasmic adaptor subunit [Thermoanaerobaculia bacterium]